MWRLPSSSMAELTVGYSLMAATRARTANGMGDSDTPSRCLNSSLARSRRRITLVMSISTALVSWALTWSEATIRWAMTLRVRVAGTTCSRRPLASGTATWGAAGGAVDCRSRPGPPAATLPVGGPPSAGWGSALAAGRWPGCSPRCWTNASTSSRRTRPPLPLPLTWLRSMSCSRARRRTSGDTPAAALPSPLPFPDRAAALSRPGRSLAAGRASGSPPWSPSPASSASPPPPPPITASSAPTSTVSSAWTLIDWRTPATGEGTSVSTLSVDTSNSGSSASTWSPSCLSQRVMVPSVIDSPSSGMVTVVLLPSPEAPALGRSSGSSAGGASEASSSPPASAAVASRSSSPPASSLPSSGWAASSAVSSPEPSPPSACASWPSPDASASPPPSPPPSPSCSMMASSAPTSTVSSAWTLMVFRTPATGDGTSVSTLSVDTSNRGSSASTRSPSCLIHRVIVPSVIDSPSSGILTGVAIDHRLPGLLAGSELVEAASGERHVGLADGFGQGRVGVDELGDVDRQGLPVVDQHRLGDQVGDPGPDQVDPEHRAVLGGNDLDHAPQAVDQALGGGVERELVDDHLVALLLGLGLGQADRRHLGGGEGDPRDAGVVDRRRALAGDRLGDQHALGEGGVGQGQRRRRQQVAERVHALDVGLQGVPALGDHEAAVQLDPDVLVAEVLDHRAATGGDQQQLGRHLRGLALGVGHRHRDLLVGDLGVLQLGLDHRGDAALLERPGQLALAVGVLQRDQAGQDLDDGHLGPHGAPEGGELDPDRPGPEHDHRLGQVVELQGVVGADHPLAVDLQARDRLGLGPGGQHQGPLRGQLAGPLDLHSARAGDPAAAAHDGDAVLLQVALEALDVLGDDVLAVGHRGRVVDRLDRGLDAPALRRLVDTVHHLGRVQQRLGRDAAPVEAGAAAAVLLLDHGDLEAEAGRADRGRVPAGAAP